MSNRKQQELKDLIRKCLKDDRDAQFELYSRYANSMLNCAYRIVGNREDAEDVLQDAFLAAFRNLSSFREEAAFGSWLKRIVINKSLNVLKQKKVTLTFQEDLLLDIPDNQNGVEENDFQVDPALVLKALQELPSGYRTVLSLYLLEGYDHQEIAEVLGISKSTSLTQYHRGKKKLKEQVLKLIENGQSGKVVQKS